MKFTQTTKISNIEDTDKLKNYLERFLNNTRDCLVGGLTYRNNFRCQVFERVEVNSNNEIILNHSLGVIPSFFSYNVGFGQGYTYGVITLMSYKYSPDPASGLFWDEDRVTLKSVNDTRIIGPATGYYFDVILFA